MASYLGWRPSVWLYKRGGRRGTVVYHMEQDNEGGGGGGDGCPFILLLRSSPEAILSMDYHRQSTFTNHHNLEVV